MRDIDFSARGISARRLPIEQGNIRQYNNDPTGGSRRGSRTRCCDNARRNTGSRGPGRHACIGTGCDSH